MADIEVTSLSQINNDGNIIKPTRRTLPLSLIEASQEEKERYYEEHAVEQALEEQRQEECRKERLAAKADETAQPAPYLASGRPYVYQDRMELQKVGNRCEVRPINGAWVKIKPSFTSPNDASMKVLEDILGSHEDAVHFVTSMSIKRTKPVEKTTVELPEGESYNFNGWDTIAETSRGGGIIAIDVDKLADMLSPEYILADGLLWQQQHSVLTLLDNSDLERKVGLGLKVHGLRKFMNKETIPRLMLYFKSSCKKVNIRERAPHKIAVKNGILNILTGELRQGSDEYFRSGLDVCYNPEAKAETINQWLIDTFDEKGAEFIKSILGAAITGAKAPYIVILVGPGGNGKGTLEDIVRSLAPSMFTTQRVEAIDDKFGNNGFIGKRIVWQEEVPATKKGQEAMKRLSGGATFTVEQKNINGVHSESTQAIIILDTNSPPTFDNGYATDRRIRHVNMPYTFVDNPDPKNPHQKKKNGKMSDAIIAEKDGLLNLILPYAKYYLEHNQLMNDIAVDKEFLDKQGDPLQSFIDDCMEVTEYGDSSKWVTYDSFYRHYEIYCAKVLNVVAKNKKTIRFNLKEMDIKVGQDKKVIGLKPYGGADSKWFDLK